MQCGASCGMQGGKRFSRKIHGGTDIPITGHTGYAGLMKIKGGYRPTKRNLKALRKWKRGESIGFTMRSSLKAKGLIPRANGTLRVSDKYRKRTMRAKRATRKPAHFMKMRFVPHKSIEVQQPYEYSPSREI